MTAVVLPIYSLWLRDLKHFFRQRSRLLGAVGQPFIIWLFLSAGFSGSFRAGDASYGAYLFPGIIILIALFAGIYSTISVIDDRNSGFLQGVLVSPIPRGAILAAKLLAGTTLALIQAVLFGLLLPFTGLDLSLSAVVLAAITLLFIGLALTNIGVLLAWIMRSTQGFHAAMSLLLIPMWLLSGALFPLEGASAWMQAVIRLNPLHYMFILFQRVLLPGSHIHETAVSTETALIVSGISLLVLTVSSLKVMSK